MSPMSDIPRRSAQELLDLLPEGLSGAGGEALDLDDQLDADGRSEPPLPLEAGRFELLFSLEAFSRLGNSQSAWLGEVERLLADHGLFAAALPRSAPRGSPDPARDWLVVEKQGDGPGGEGLAALLAALDAGRRREIDRLRESFHRELMRKSLRIAELEPDTATTPASWAIAERVASSYEATLSWRLTGPIRAAKRALARR